MQVRALVLALTATAMVQPASAQAEDCAQLFIYAVNQVCRTLSNGFSQCEPVGLVGPAPQCVPPGVPPLMPMPRQARQPCRCPQPRRRWRRSLRLQRPSR